MPSHQPEYRLVQTSMKGNSTPKNTATACQSLGGSETCSRADSSLAARVTSTPEMSSAPHAHRPAHNHVGGANTMSSSEVVSASIEEGLTHIGNAARDQVRPLIRSFSLTIRGRVSLGALRQDTPRSRRRDGHHDLRFNLVPLTGQWQHRLGWQRDRPENAPYGFIAGFIR